MAAGKGRKLVIVESPAKAKTIAGYLGGDFEVEASVGHIRDLPNPSELPADMKKGPFGKFAVDVDNGFEPYYVVDPDKKKKVAELKRLLKDAGELYLATDEDREGEAIAWHLLEALKPRVPVKRMVFHEITREAIQRAVNDTREIDTALVDAQETRRILDRLYGYEVSPVLWRKVRQGLSAGRVQSVATRMVVERERERMAFVRASYWDVEGDFTPDGREPAVHRAPVVGRRRPRRHRPRLRRRRPPDRQGRRPPRRGARDPHRRRRCLPLTARVTDVQEKPYTRRPSAPFTTSTLQQEASRKLRMSSKNAMRVAQRLYENGYITYMRTDSTTLSDAATTAARSQARDMYGAEYVPDSPRRYEKKVKNAQEAHEAIRPAGDRFRSPAQVAGSLRGEEFALYELIWKRTVASQMADARGSTATVKLAVDTAVEGAQSVEFSASGTVITFKGFLAAYEEGRDDEAAARADAAAEERRLPKLERRGPARGRARRGRRPRDEPARPLHRGHARQGDGGARHRPPVDVCRDDRHDPGPRLRLHQGPGARADVARLRRDAPARGALRQPRRLRVHRLDGGGPRPHRQRRRGPRRVAEALLLRRGGHLGRRAAQPRRGPRRDRRQGDLDDPDRRRHGRARRALRPLRRGARARGRRPRDG